MPKGIPRYLILIRWICFFTLSGLVPCFALAGGIPATGSYLPDLKIEAPASEKGREYLGIGDEKTFSVKQVNSPFTLIEIVGVYCPKCHAQAPLFNKLFYRLKKAPALFEKIRMLAIAAGANSTEVDYMKKEFSIPFPVVKDPRFEIHKSLGEPRTPFTMIVSKDGKVVFAHLGIIKDIDDFFLQIMKL
ncbi:MAG: TlpA family protein disulfide reductase [Desulfobacteraceae bacterium]|nr:TlpA family protein disulfide reductase [Desulfobacteraceae bacterium]